MVAVFTHGASPPGPLFQMQNARVQRKQFVMPRINDFDYLQLCCLVVIIRVWGGHHLFKAKTLLARVQYVGHNAVHKNPAASDKLHDAVFDRRKALFHPRFIAFRRNNGTFSRKFIQVQPGTLPQ